MEIEQVMRISQLRLFYGDINFDKVLKVIARIEKRSREDDRFKPDGIKVDHDCKQICEGIDIFWACVCLGLDNVLCEVCRNEPMRDDFDRINVTGNLANIPPDKRAEYRMRIDDVCRQHEPPLTVEWPVQWEH